MVVSLCAIAGIATFLGAVGIVSRALGWIARNRQA